ncbi:MAG: c-type cytochrome [Acidobacteriota bacterium]
MGGGTTLPWEYQDKLLTVATLFALLTLGTIVYAVWREEHPVWERYERGYREAMVAAVADFPEDRREATLASIQAGAIQDYIREASIVDRCRTCHRGIDNPLMADAPQPYRTHSGDTLRDHPPSRFGCTICHGGQGPSLAGVDAAHGRAAFWDQPMLPLRYVEASCGRCHRVAEVPASDVLKRGRDVARRECDGCHEGDDRPRGAKTLRYVGIKRSGRWLAGYLSDPDSEHARHWSSEPIQRDDFDALISELTMRRGAEKLLRGELLYNERGCGGCHQIQGVGGVLGVDLTEEGLRLPRQLDFRYVRASGGVVAWQEAHLIKPESVVPETTMIDPKLRSNEVELLVSFVLSLYPRWNYDAWRPPDHDGFREEAYKADPARGKALYGRYCAACHGRNGRGRIDIVHGGYAPALFNATFLALADPEFLVYNIANGREERNMPAWRQTGGLRETDIRSIVLFLNSKPRADTPEFLGPFRGSAEEGRATYEVQCAGCHGESGEGGVGPALALPGVQKAGDEYLYATIALGRPGTAMLPYDLPGGNGLPRERIADLVAYIRLLPEAYDD